MNAGISLIQYFNICTTPPPVIVSELYFLFYQPYSVKKFGCVAGIMVTASHNPKDDNGYKVQLSTSQVSLT